MKPSAIEITATLAVDLTRRLLREGVVLRSLVFPALLSAAAMVLTVVGVTLLRPPRSLAVTPEVDAPELRAAAEENGWGYHVLADPRAPVVTGDVSVGTDGQTIWRHRSSTGALAVEATVRQHLDAGWWVKVDDAPSRQAVTARSGDNLLRFIGALFAMYGVVFGAGSVARDRDEGTLDAELATAAPRWVHGAARWLAGTFVLSAYFALGVAIFQAFIGLSDPLVMCQHGAAACGGAVAIGLIVVGRAGIEQGFMAPISVGLVCVAGLLGWALSVQHWDGFVPIASLMRQGVSGWFPMAHALLWGAVAVAVFTWRSTSE